DIEAIENFANDQGLDVVQTSVSQRAVRLSGTVAAMQAAFGTRLRCYQQAKSKTWFRGRTGTVSVPKNIAAIIEGVFGLDNRPQARPHFHIRSTKKKFLTNAASARPMTPVEVAKFYNFPGNLKGSG